LNRIGVATVLLLAGPVFAQPQTYFAPIAARTPASSPVGATAMQTALWLPDPGVDAGLSLLFGTGGGTSVPFLLGNQAPASLSGFPPQVDAVAAAPGVRVGSRSVTLLAVSSGGAVTFGTVESGVFVPKVPLSPIPAGTQIALSAVPGGGAALLTSDGFRITRWDLDLSSGNVVATRGLDIPASPGGVGATDESSSITFDGVSNEGYVGGRVVGDLYRFDAHLDAGPPRVFDPALASQGRLAPPVSGLAVYSGQSARYLLAANGQGITVYDLTRATPPATAFRVIPEDALGQITSPAGVAVTNLPAGAALPGGVIAVGDRTHTDLALVRWDLLAGQVDGGLVVDTTTDPRGPGGGGPDAGCPDGGTPLSDGGCPAPGPGPGGGPVPGAGPTGPGIPVDHSTSCTSAGGGPALLALLASLGLLLPGRRQRR